MLHIFYYNQNQDLIYSKFYYNSIVYDKFFVGYQNSYYHTIIHILVYDTNGVNSIDSVEDYNTIWYNEKVSFFQVIKRTYNYFKFEVLEYKYRKRKPRLLSKRRF